MPERALISLGSNVDPEKYLPLAVKRLEELGPLIGVSMVYQNPAIGSLAQPDFLNAAALVETELSAAEIRQRLRQIEADLGRTRSADKNAPRTIDLDLCLLGAQVLDTPEFTLPDPSLLARAHLAIPLAELDPDFLYPTTGEPLRTIASRLATTARLTPRPDIVLKLP